MRFICALVLLCIVSSNANASEQLFRDEQYNFRLAYPSDWRQVPTRGVNVRVSVTSEQGRGLANCNAGVRPIPELSHMTRSEIEEEFSGNITDDFIRNVVAGSILDVEFLLTKEDKLDNRPAGFAVFLQTYRTAGVEATIKHVQAFTFAPLGMYIISCSAILEEYDLYEMDIMRIMISFVIEDWQR